MEPICVCKKESPEFCKSFRCPCVCDKRKDCRSIYHECICKTDLYRCKSSQEHYCTCSKNQKKCLVWRGDHECSCEQGSEYCKLSSLNHKCSCRIDEILCKHKNQWSSLNTKHVCIETDGAEARAMNVFVIMILRDVIHQNIDVIVLTELVNRRNINVFVKPINGIVESMKTCKSPKHKCICKTNK